MPQKKTKLADVSEFEDEDSRIIATVQGQEIAVFRHDGEFYAVANFCPHQSGPLCEGALTGVTEMADDGWGWAFDNEQKNISCPWHGWTFDITDGQSVKENHLAVPTFDIEVEDGSVFLSQ